MSKDPRRFREYRSLCIIAVVEISIYFFFLFFSSVAIELDCG